MRSTQCRALCAERMGRLAEAARCYRAAISLIRASDDGIQSWIAVDGAKRLARLERGAGMVATADYWKTQSQAFADAYSIE